jgi:hypothetical protein
MKHQNFNPKNPWIFTKKTAFMQRIADRIKKTSVQYIQGQTKLNKVAFKVVDLASRYPLNLSAMTQSRARKSGHGVYNWLGYFEEATGFVHWVVLYEAGKTIDRSEAWRNPRLDPVKLTGYNLVRLARGGVGDALKQPSWTWRYTTRQHDDLRDAIASAVKGRRDLELKKLIHSIYRSPGFAGVRDQVKKMGELVKGDWKRYRSRSEVMPELPKQIGYVRRLENVGDVWSEVVKGNKNERVQKEA